jgi:hypothetical protein
VPWLGHVAFGVGSRRERVMVMESIPLEEVSSRIKPRKHVKEGTSCVQRSVLRVVRSDRL